ncbi:MAG: YihY/virulence factor BrkB family protein [Bacteroidales bacterium]
MSILRRSGRWLARQAREVVLLTGQSIYRGFLEFYNSDDLTYAASIAYYGLLSLFPFFLLVLSIIGNATADPNNREAAVSFVLRYFPEQFTFLSRQLDALQGKRLQLGIGGSAALIWAAMGVFGAVSSAVNHAWGVEKQRSFVRHKVFSFLMLVAAGALLFATLLLVGAIQVVGASWFAEVVHRFPTLTVLTGFALQYAVAAMMIVVVGLIFYFVPNAQVRFRDVWVGAIITGLLWKAMVTGFSWYIRDMSRFNAINGSIAAVVVFLVWVYASAIILLYGVEVTAVYARLRRHRPTDLPAAPSPRT